METNSNELITTPMEILKYTFYFEINQSNYRFICNSNKYFTQFKGYDWDNVFDTNPNCNYCSNEGENNYPITNTSKTNQSIPIGEGGLEIEKNTFLITDDVKITDTVTMSCGTYLQTEGCIPYQYSNLCLSEEVTPSIIEETTPTSFEETTPIPKKTIELIDGNKITQYSQSVTCNGKDCLKFFPPSELTYNNSYLYNPKEEKNNIIDCNTKNLDYSAGYPACFDNNGNPTEICYDGNPLVNYNLYKPLNYSKFPSVDASGNYIPPSTPINAGFYNFFPLIANLELVQSYTDNGSNIPEGSLAIYKVDYSLRPDEFENQGNQLNDFTNLQEYLDTTFSSWFKTTTLYQTTQENINQIISDYCYYTSDKSNPLCKIETFQVQPSFFDKHKLQIIVGFIVIFLVIFIFFKQ